MKVIITDKERAYIPTLNLQDVQKMIEDLDNDSVSIDELCQKAAKVAICTNKPIAIADCSAKLSRNRNVSNYYGELTDNYDVWIDFVASTDQGDYACGIYLSDVRSINSNPWNNDRIAKRMFIKKMRENDLAFVNDRMYVGEVVDGIVRAVLANH